jgi:lysophospholipase L1-like esterase
MRKLILALSLSLNVVGVLGVSAWVLKKGGTRYVAEQFGLVRAVAPTRAFQQDAVDEFRQWPNGEGEVVFAGDSITRAMPWEELTPVRNRGIGGDTSDGLLRRFDEITASAPAQVFINIGTNDLSRGFAVTDVLANVRKMVSRCESGTQVLIVSVLPINVGLDDKVVNRNKRKAIPVLNAGLRKIAEDAGATYIDLWPAFADTDGQLRADLTSDGVHLSVAGKILYAETIRPYVRVPK